MLFYSTVFSCMVMGGLVLFQKKTSVLASYSIRDYSKVGVLGFLGTYVYYVLLYGALALTSASEGFILAYTWPMLDSPGVSFSEGEADGQKTLLHLHQLCRHYCYCDAWTPFHSELDQPARRSACAWGSGCLCALFRPREEIPLRSSRECVPVLCDRACVYHSDTVSLLFPENALLACVVVAFPQWLSGQWCVLHLLVEGTGIWRYLCHLKCVVFDPVSLACLHRALFRRADPSQFDSWASNHCRWDSFAIGEPTPENACKGRNG